eukprot:scaffold8235_cov439-Pinguiococcus_pyrenoidosus.AAC.1
MTVVIGSQENRRSALQDGPLRYAADSTHRLLSVLGLGSQIIEGQGRRLSCGDVVLQLTVSSQEQ